MKHAIGRDGVGASFVALCVVTLLGLGCSSDAQPVGGTAGANGDTNVSGGSAANTPIAGNAGVGSNTAGTAAGGGASVNAGGTGGGAGVGTAGVGGGGGVSAAGAPGGAGSSVAGVAGGGGTSAGGGVTTTVELIGPGGATCGATNATHGDGFVCVLSYPSAGANVIGYWFDYAFAPNTCNVSFTKPAGNNASNPQVCFSGNACAATSGGGLGLALCDVHGIDVSTWPELKMLESTSALSPTAKSPAHSCNPGAVLTSVSWVLSSGSLPAGTSVLFDDAADVSVARVDGLPAGATSVAVPGNVDASKIATIKFAVNGASSATWNFCLSSLKVSLR